MSYLIYDGECPVCSRYADYLVLRKAYPGLELLNARGNENHPAVAKVLSAGKVLDEGMAIVDGDKVIHGADVMAAVASKGSLLASESRARGVYPFLRAGRNLLLKLRGRGKLGF
jgi:predicted DCC family thiol-disulfide oxidoreductase YuxK